MLAIPHSDSPMLWVRKECDLNARRLSARNSVRSGLPGEIEAADDFGVFMGKRRYDIGRIGQPLSPCGVCGLGQESFPCIVIRLFDRDRDGGTVSAELLQRHSRCRCGDFDVRVTVDKENDVGGCVVQQGGNLVEAVRSTSQIGWVDSCQISRCRHLKGRYADLCAKHDLEVPAPNRDGRSIVRHGLIVDIATDTNDRPTNFSLVARHSAQKHRFDRASALYPSHERARRSH